MEMIGKALDSGKVETLEIPPFATRAFSAQPLNPLDLYAGARMMAFGMTNATGHRVLPWRKRRMSRGAQQAAQGRAMIYSPLGVGVAQ